MAVSVLETIKSRANASNTAYIAVLSLLCDTYTDLPTQYGLTGYELAQGCKAHVIDTNTDYMLDSTGTWHIYGGEIWQNVYTKTETDALLDDKQDELTTAQLDAVNSGITAAKLTADEAALAEVVDNGAKNRLTINSGSSTRWIYIPVSVEAGKYRVYFGTLTSDDTDATTCQACFLDSNSTQVSDWLSFNRGSNVSDDATLTSTATKILLYSSDSYAHSAGDTVTFTNGMVCTAADWAVSQKFVPYCPSMAEMYQMILALQSN